MVIHGPSGNLQMGGRRRGSGERAWCCCAFGCGSVIYMEVVFVCVFSFGENVYYHLLILV